MTLFNRPLPPPSKKLINYCFDIFFSFNLGITFQLRDIFEQHARETILFRTNIKKPPDKLYLEGVAGYDAAGKDT